MSRRRHTPEQVVRKLREADTLLGECGAAGGRSSSSSRCPSAEGDREGKLVLTMENPFVESFNSRVRDELLAVEMFTGLAEAKVMIEDFRQDYNRNRRHRAHSRPAVDQSPAAPAANRISSCDAAPTTAPERT
jgi:hypothetical protein